MNENKVVARFKNGTIQKGTTRDFFPNKDMFHLKTAKGEMLDIQVAELKALYFVKTHEGNRGRMDKYTDKIAGGGRKVQVKFADGETMIGYTQGYSPARSGFFLIPADSQSNNERIYIIVSSTEKIKFLQD